MMMNLKSKTPKEIKPMKADNSIGKKRALKAKMIDLFVLRLNIKNGSATVNQISAGDGSTKTKPDRKTYMHMKKT